MQPARHKGTTSVRARRVGSRQAASLASRDVDCQRDTAKSTTDKLLAALRAVPAVAATTDGAALAVTGTTANETRAACIGDLCAAPALSEAARYMADALHAMYLVTMIAKAQVKAASYPRRAVVSAAAVGERAVADSQPATRAVVDERWLAAVTQCRSVRTTLDDLARVAAAFPHYLRVRWSMTEPGVALRQSAIHDIDRSSGGEDDVALMSSSHAPTGDLCARVYLLSDHVPSVQEAGSALCAAWRAAAKDGDDERQAEQAWQRCCYEGVTAYKAWRAQQTSPPPCEASSVTRNGTHDVTGAAEKGVTREAAERLTTTSLDAQSGSNDGCCFTHLPALATQDHNTVVTRAKRARGRSDGVDGTDGNSSVSPQQEAKMLRTMSAELRASLSDTKLREVVRQMCRDEAQVETREQERIERARDREQLLRTYEHVLSLFGRKHTVRNAAQVLQALMEQEGDGHGGDYRAACRQVQLLLQAHAATGLSALTGSEQGGLRAVSDLTSLSAEQLRWTLIGLRRDRTAVTRLAAELDNAGQTSIDV